MEIIGTLAEIAWAKEMLHGSCMGCPARSLCRSIEAQESHLPDEQRTTCQQVLEQGVRFTVQRADESPGQRIG